MALKWGGGTGSETQLSLIRLLCTGSLVYSFSARNYRILQINKGVVSEQRSSGAETPATTIQVKNQNIAPSPPLRTPPQ